MMLGFFIEFNLVQVSSQKQALRYNHKGLT
jgi:hypothetical protein